MNIDVICSHHIVVPNLLSSLCPYNGIFTFYFIQICSNVMASEWEHFIFEVAQMCHIKSDGSPEN